METVVKTIGGIELELETWEEAGEPRSSLFLRVTDPADGATFAGSLPLCEAMGGIPWDEGGDINGKELWPIHSGLFDKISGWAHENGY